MTAKSTDIAPVLSLRSISAAFFCFFLLHSAAYAGAWTHPKGKAQLITGSSYYHTSRYYDRNGDKKKQSPYTKNESFAYGEYGLSDNITLGGRLAYIAAAQQGTTRDFAASGIGDTELFLRTKLWQNDSSVVSLQPYVVLPSPDDKRSLPKIGADSAALGLRVGYGRNIRLHNRSHYVDSSITYLHRAGTPQDQIKAETTLGYNITDSWQLIPQLFATHARKMETTGFTQSSADDYDLATAQLNLRYRISEKSAVQLGGSQALYGRNTGHGRAITASYERVF